MREQLLWMLGQLSGRHFETHKSPSPLRFPASGQFKISIFEDLHFGEAEHTTWGPRQDAATLSVMSTLLDVEKPDLVVLNGDLITGDDTFLDNSTSYLDLLVAPLISRAIPWASTYGNHDINYNLSTSALLAREHRYPLSHTQQHLSSPSAGVSNYYLPIYPPSTTSETSSDTTAPSLILYFFDSRGGRAYQRLQSDNTTIPLPSVVSPSVVSWFRATSTALATQHKRHIPSLAFVHIPSSLMRALEDDDDDLGHGVHPHRQPGLNEEPAFTPQDGDDEFVRALLDTEGLMVVFSGHQHGNDWCGARPRSRTPASSSSSSSSSSSGDKHNAPHGHGQSQKELPPPPPLFACFGRHTGYGGYGRWERGARQVVLDLKTMESGEGEGEGVGVGEIEAEIETWVRLERGGVSGHVVLNATYGEDVYPKVRKTFTRLDDDDDDDREGGVVDAEAGQ
ncbi:uncharacterized protein HMPREF1541_07427 [Cyphellophora europaea CBS 101466]|uniref:Calcineurin-like phosphoesterase domain-containing protein n=1 Tax=Cyphellophora europaea (strain CBS 101466) TaxID=1220924 RepID=W2RPZ6_CYPE1|nr:uncharacterized protein HMPREF1541_07427 [Cyphellophora europaea CBS 101466]ETN37804.1 hypothetical protein HMPREF1541_07427 [Cyphellophora europaea CBS 101466]